MHLSLADLPPDAILLNETRREPDADLLRSIREHGVLTPVVVRETGPAAYQLLEGSRRVRAALQLRLYTLPAIVEPEGMAGMDADEYAIQVNQQRDNLSQVHLGRHVRRLLDQRGISQARLARQLHLDPGLVNRMLKVVACPELVTAIEEEKVSFGSAKGLVALAPDVRAELLAELRATKVATGHFPTVRQVEAMVQRRRGKSAPVDLPREALPALAQALQTREVPVETETVSGRRTHLRVVLVIAKEDRTWLPDVVGSLQRK